VRCPWLLAEAKVATIFSELILFLLSSSTAIQNHRRSCHRVSNFGCDSADTCAEKFPLMSMGGLAEGLVCADPEARTPIGESGNVV
jgi:hypothetical protein